MTTVLLTGFEPFGGDAVNPSGDAVRAVAASWDAPERLVTAVLPVSFAAAAAELERLVDAHSPDVVIAAGLAGGRDGITPERIAVNLADARIPDNDGDRPLDAPVVAGGPDARFTGLPVKAIVAELSARGIRSSLSTTAGTYVCNAVFYAGTELAARRPGMRAGFIHVPYASESAPDGAPSLPAVTIAEALAIACRVALDTPADLALAGGSLH
ncbi:pyroglutamyl-peptidase I [Agromyces sp. SYSU T00194]|uniref:pyroglutamyl-peptidase I n=1 Tax=Agromyces chitinivorans TaxID=3158560 RepID=UPI00339183DD